MQSLQG